MIKRLLLFSFLFFSFVQLDAQTYGNEWINYSQKYYKIKVAQTGIYKINYTTLVNAGIPITTTDPKRLQLFNRGVEQKIYIEGESDGTFNTTDFIEFYGQKNDGSLDSLLYTNTSFVPNPYYSLVNDTAVYYLTWNNSTANKRITVESDVNFGAYPTLANYFFKEEIHDFHSLKIKNIEIIVIGKYEIEAWYYSPFPTQFQHSKYLYFCEFCLKYMKKKESLVNHIVRV